MANHTKEQEIERLAIEFGVQDPRGPQTEMAYRRLFALIAAIEERNLARVAMLVDALEAQDKLSRTGLFYAKPHEIESVQELRRQALSAAQPSAAAYVAEVEARAIRKFIEGFSFEDAVNQYRCQYCKEDDGEGNGLPLVDALCAVGMPFGNAQTEVELLADYIGGAMLDELRMAAEKRKQADSGKEGGEL